MARPAKVQPARAVAPKDAFGSTKILLPFQQGPGQHNEPTADRLQWPPVGRRPFKAEEIESNASPDQSGQSRKKAEPVKSACVQCQKRKTKCSGERPVCRFCSDRKLECSWDVGDGVTRAADLKQKLLEARQGSDGFQQQLLEARQGSDDLDALMCAMRSESDEISTMLLAKLRMGASVEDLATSVRDPSPAGRAGSADWRPDGSSPEVSERSDGVSAFHRQCANWQRTVTNRSLNDADHTLPTSPAHSTGWTGVMDSPFQQQAQSELARTVNLDLYRPSDSRSSNSFLSSENTQSSTNGCRNDSFQNEDALLLDYRTQKFQELGSKDPSAVSQVTLVPKRLTNAPAPRPSTSGPVFMAAPE